jgi:toxin CptA
MPNWKRSSPASVPCRLEWRRSRWQALILLALAVLVVPAVWLSGLPVAAQWALGIAGLAWTVGALHAEWRRAPCVLVIPPSPSAPACLDGQAIADLALAWRGPLAFVGFRQGRRRRTLVFWPDTLSAAQRRELRLAVSAREASSRGGVVAP